MEQEVVVVTDKFDQVVCHGGHGALGHPAVYYSLVEQDEVTCGYCGRRFVRSARVA